MDIGYLTRHATWHLRSSDPDAPAVSLEDVETWTYHELHARANAVGNALLDAGILPGDRVAMLLHNCLEYWAAYLGATRIGAVAVRLNFRLTAHELEFMLDDSGAAGLVVHAALLERVAGRAGALAGRVWVVPDGPAPSAGPAAAPAPSPALPAWARPWAELAAGSPEAPAVPRPRPEDDAMIMYTSGTTGLPKGAVWTHANTTWFDTIQAARFGFARGSVTMVCGPMYHGGAVEVWSTAALAAGGHAVVLRSGGFDIERVLETVARQRVDSLLLFPFMIYDLLALPGLEQRDLSSLRRIMSGGDPLLPWATERLAQLFPWIEITQVFGLTEGGAISTATLPEHARLHPECVGLPIPLTEVALRDDDGRDVPPGEVGEIWVRSPGVSPRYWNRPEESAATFVDGWCLTGDLGRLNHAGLLVVAGRKKDMIRSGGENVYPAELEDVLARHDGVREVAVIGVPDERWLEAVCAVVVPEEGWQPDAEPLLAWCRERLAGYKRPRHVVFRESLPRTASGKVVKHELRSEYRALGETAAGRGAAT